MQTSTASFTQRLGLRYPILQAPMAGSQSSRLALAVSRVGALLGALPGAMLSHEALRTELSLLQASGLPYNVNFFCHTNPQPNPNQLSRWHTVLTPYYTEYGLNTETIPSGATRVPFDPAIADILAELSPPVVSFHFGLPGPALIQKIKS